MGGKVSQLDSPADFAAAGLSERLLSDLGDEVFAGLLDRGGESFNGPGILSLPQGICGGFGQG